MAFTDFGRSHKLFLFCLIFPIQEMGRETLAQTQNKLAEVLLTGHSQMLYRPTPPKLLLFIGWIKTYYNISSCSAIWVDPDFVTDRRYRCITTKKDQENLLLWQLCDRNQVEPVPSFLLFMFFFFQRCVNLNVQWLKGSVNFV